MDNRVLQILTGINYHDLMVTADIDTGALTDEQLGTIVEVAVICCVNGPVGLRKPTNFPNVQGQVTIRELFDPVNISIASWTKFCGCIARQITTVPITHQGNQYMMHGMLWPLHCKKPDGLIDARTKRVLITSNIINENNGVITIVPLNRANNPNARPLRTRVTNADLREAQDRVNAEVQAANALNQAELEQPAAQ